MSPKLPFEEEEKEFVPRIGLKKIDQQSMFDNKPKKQTPQEFQKKVQSSQDRQSDNKQRAAALFIQFNKCMADKTLPQNQNVFFHETEREMLQKMMQLSSDITRDDDEEDGMGALTWIALLLKTCLSQRNKINEMEYAIVNLQKNAVTSDFVSKEIAKALDKKKENG